MALHNLRAGARLGICTYVLATKGRTVAEARGVQYDHHVPEWSCPLSIRRCDARFLRVLAFVLLTIHAPALSANASGFFELLCASPAAGRFLWLRKRLTATSSKENMAMRRSTVDSFFWRARGSRSAHYEIRHAVRVVCSARQHMSPCSHTRCGVAHKEVERRPTFLVRLSPWTIEIPASVQRTLSAEESDSGRA